MLKTDGTVNYIAFGKQKAMVKKCCDCTVIDDNNFFDMLYTGELLYCIVFHE